MYFTTSFFEAVSYMVYRNIYSSAVLWVVQCTLLHD